MFPEKLSIKIYKISETYVILVRKVSIIKTTDILD